MISKFISKVLDWYQSKFEFSRPTIEEVDPVEELRSNLSNLHLMEEEMEEGEHPVQQEQPQPEQSAQLEQSAVLPQQSADVQTNLLLPLVNLLQEQLAAQDRKISALESRGGSSNLASSAAKPQRFSGKFSLSFSTWSQSLKAYMDAVRTAEKDRVSLAITYLEPAPQTAWDQFLSTIPEANLDAVASSWSEFCNFMMARFDEPVVVHTTRTKLHSIKLGDSSIAEYNQRFLALCQRIPANSPGALGEVEKCHAYLEGLPVQLRGSLMNDPATNGYWREFNALLAAASAKGAAYAGGAERNVKRIRRGGGNKQQPQQNQQYAAAAAGPSQYPAASFQPPMSAQPVFAAAQSHIVCHHCGQSGHIRPQCPMPAGQFYGGGAGAGRGRSVGRGRGRGRGRGGGGFGRGGASGAAAMVTDDATE